jgi:hypothetical protein
MAAPEEINADMLAFWNGKGGDIWVARQEHTDITLAPVTNALLVFAAPRAGVRMWRSGSRAAVGRRPPLTPSGFTGFDPKGDIDAVAVASK